MTLRCPNCYDRLNLASYCCSRGHEFAIEDGVLILLNDSFKARLTQFTGQLQKIRGQEQKRIIDTSAYNRLPFIETKADQQEWQIRRYDLGLILEHLRARHKLHDVLDISAWNGWLSHQLARRGHRVTAIDYFTDEYDGLRAKKFYDTTWQAIQMDLTELSILDQAYDLVILNHGLHFFSDPLAQVVAAKQRLAENGLLMLIGLQVFWWPTPRQRYIQALQQRYRDQYNFDLFLNPTKGYLSWSELRQIQALGVQIQVYPNWWGYLRTMKAMLNPAHSLFFYGVYEASTATR